MRSKPLQSWILFVSFVLLFMSSCGEDDPVSFPTILLPPKIEGRWVGSIPGLIDIALDLTQDRSKILGSGTISGIGPTTNITIGGSNWYPDIEFTVGISGYQPIGVRGRLVSPSSIDATLNGSGFSGNAITFNKQ